MSNLSRLCAFAFTVAAVTATSPTRPMQIAFNVDLAGRDRAVYAVRTLDSTDGGALTLPVSFSVIDVGVISDAGTSPDGGLNALSELVIASSASLPSAAGLTTARAATVEMGETVDGLGEVLLLGDYPRLRSRAQEFVGNANVTVGSTPIYLSFVRRDVGEVAVQMTFMMGTSCAASTCPQLVFDDVTADVH